MSVFYVLHRYIIFFIISNVSISMYCYTPSYCIVEINYFNYVLILWYLDLNRIKSFRVCKIMKCPKNPTAVHFPFYLSICNAFHVKVKASVERWIEALTRITRKSLKQSKNGFTIFPSFSKCLELCYFEIRVIWTYQDSGTFFKISLNVI